MAEETLVAAAAEPEVAPPEKETKDVPPPAADEKSAVEPEIITQTESFKEETNVVAELADPQKKALDELKQLVDEALKSRSFTPPPPPAEPEKPAPETECAPVEKTQMEESAEKLPEEPVAKAEEVSPPLPEKTPEEAQLVEEEGVKTVEAIEESVVPVAAPPPPSADTVETTEAVPPPPPVEPEEVFLWGIKLLECEKTDTILLKFLRARDFKVKDAFEMLKNTVQWRKEFGIDALLEEDLNGTGLEKAVFINGVDKEGHPVCYNVFGEFQNKELFQKTFSDAEKRQQFLRWRIQFLEREIRKLDFSPDGVCSMVNVIDLKNSPGLFNRDLNATKKALELMLDNYPEFVAKQIVVNVPWWYLAYNRVLSPIFTPRSKSKFVYAGPSRSAETLFKYISPQQLPVQFGGLSKESDLDFSAVDTAIDVIVKPTSMEFIEFPVTETCTLVWELRVLGWDVIYGAEFVPDAEEGYTVIVSKSRKVLASEEAVIRNSFKVGEPGKIVLKIENNTSKKKKLLYRSKAKACDLI